uniref:Uncharacterized protein n=1 Tax=Romanomermis culicivorax TaxID=13658 RepID=A0A915JXU4_ROMCU
MCRYLTKMQGYRPKEQWSLETAYNYFVHCLRDLLVKWARMSKNQEGRKEADELANKAHQRAKGQLWIKKLLDPKIYNRNIRPQIGRDGKLSPTIVKTTLAINSLGAVREYTMEFKAQFRFQQEWFDHRLIFNDSTFGDRDYLFLAHDQRIWYPDTFFQNEKTARYHDFDQPNVFVTVRKDGYVIYNRRLTMTFACTMKLKKYPLDSQLCFIEFASYAYTTADIIYVWSEKPLDIGIESVKALSNFRILYYGNDSCTSNTSTGAYSCLRVVLYMKRVFSFFFLQLYIPSTLLVAVSWVSYWIDWRAAAGRVPLAIVTLLAMITQSHAINANLPPVSYAKAIDVWVGACVMFIFGSLLEYALVNFTGISDQKKKAEIDEKRLGQFGAVNFFDQVPLTEARTAGVGASMGASVMESQNSVPHKSGIFGESTVNFED